MMNFKILKKLAILALAPLVLASGNHVAFTGGGVSTQKGGSTSGHFTYTNVGSKHLPTYECGLDITAFNIQTKTLHFRVCADCSLREFTKYKITQQEDKLFIDLYGRWPAIFISKSNGKFDYTLPDGVNEIYLRGPNPKDTKLIWQKS